MCGRFTLRQSGHAIAQAFDLAEVPYVESRYNIAPTQPVAAIIVEGNAATRQLTHFYWGLIPSWAKDPKMATRLINARSETVSEKPAFRNAFKRRRCLIVADGFYEWQPQGKVKQPFYFQLEGDRPFAFAGLWEHWDSAEGDSIQSCTILTTDCNAVLQPVHHRMPVILAEHDYDVWLDPSVQKPELLQPLLKPYPEAGMMQFPVSLGVNNPSHDAPDCIAPLPA